MNLNLNSAELAINTLYTNILHNNAYTDDFKKNEWCEGNNDGVNVYEKLTALSTKVTAQWVDLCRITQPKRVIESATRGAFLPTIHVTKQQRKTVLDVLNPLKPEIENLIKELDCNRLLYSGKQCFFFYTRLNMIEGLHKQARVLCGRAYALNPPKDKK